jgi:hypothetical protein
MVDLRNGIAIPHLNANSVTLKNGCKITQINGKRFYQLLFIVKQAELTVQRYRNDSNLVLSILTKRITEYVKNSMLF